MGCMVACTDGVGVLSTTIVAFCGGWNEGDDVRISGLPWSSRFCTVTGLEATAIRKPKHAIVENKGMESFFLDRTGILFVVTKLLDLSLFWWLYFYL